LNQLKNELWGQKMQVVIAWLKDVMDNHEQ
jgi:hypothetical protein